MNHLRPALFLVAVFVILTGVLFPLAVTAVAQAAFPHQANGSLIRQDGRIVGSELLGQPFARPEYFHPRPSAAGSGYDGANSSGTNLGPTSDKLINGAEGFDGVKQLAAKYRKDNGLALDAVLPTDAVTRSGSGLDPHISPRNAALQARRVAKARNLPIEDVRRLIGDATSPALLGVFGDPAVNVVRLNLALDRQSLR